MDIRNIDHLVLTVRSIDATAAFYETVLGTKIEEFGEGRVALRFGDQKINLHQAGRELEPKAARPTPGSADLCFIADGTIDAVAAHIESCSLEIEEGPVPRTGALGPIMSVYFRDPDQNLIEVSTYLTEAAR